MNRPIFFLPLSVLSLALLPALAACGSSSSGGSGGGQASDPVPAGDPAQNCEIRCEDAVSACTSTTVTCVPACKGLTEGALDCLEGASCDASTIAACSPNFAAGAGGSGSGGSGAGGSGECLSQCRPHSERCSTSSNACSTLCTQLTDAQWQCYVAANCDAAKQGQCTSGS